AILSLPLLSIRVRRTLGSPLVPYTTLFRSRRPTFVLGQSYPRGVWFYFPVVFAFKSPLGFLLLPPLSLLIALRRQSRSASSVSRSEEHTSELQSRFDLVCRLLLEKKNPPSN